MGTNEILKEIWKESKAFSPEDDHVMDRLGRLTKELMDSYHSQGRAIDDPFAPTRVRSLSLPEKELREMIKGSTCLITGGSGCVGSQLVANVLEFEPRSVVIVDIKPPKEKIEVKGNSKVFYEDVDITDSIQLNNVFSAYQPDLVFHTAAQRDPGLAEKMIALTLQTNIQGTFNVLMACESTHSVKKCVFSSTGKASRYFTEEIYAGSKKICEHLFSAFQSTGKVGYSMVRFTHILDNSLMDRSLRKMAIEADFVKVHSQCKYVTAQNVMEASQLMLNGLLSDYSQNCEFLLVKNLEWPVESLEVALYYLHFYGRKTPILFTGNPKGYGEKFFRGQLDWNNPQDLNLLINVFECKEKKVNNGGDIISSKLIPVSPKLVMEVLEEVKLAGADEIRLVETLNSSMENLLMESLDNVSTEEIVNVLKWGADEMWLKHDGIELSDFEKMTSIFLRALNRKEKSKGKISSLNHVFQLYA